MSNRIGEVIDLKAYRDRKVGRSLTATETEVFADDFHYGQTPLTPFAIPVAFFVFWPEWFFVSHAPVLNKDGSGAA